MYKIFITYKIIFQKKKKKKKKKKKNIIVFSFIIFHYINYLSFYHEY